MREATPFQQVARTATRTCHAVDLPRAAANDAEREHRRASQLVRLLLWNVLQSAAQPNTAAAVLKSAWTRSLNCRTRPKHGKCGVSFCLLS